MDWEGESGGFFSPSAKVYVLYSIEDGATYDYCMWDLVP